MIYIYILLFVYWFLCVAYMIEDWTKDFDLDAGTLILIMVLFWIPAPFIFLSEMTKNIIIMKKRDKNG